MPERIRYTVKYNTDRTNSFASIPEVAAHIEAMLRRWTTDTSEFKITIKAERVKETNKE